MHVVAGGAWQGRKFDMAKFFKIVGICSVAFFALIVMLFMAGSGGVSQERYDRMTPEQKAAEDHRQQTGLYPEQEAAIAKHCAEVPRPWDC